MAAHMTARSEILQTIKIPQEDELRHLLREHPLVKGGVDLSEGNTDRHDLDLRLKLKQEMELTRASHPSLFAFVDEASARLGISLRACRVFKSFDAATENASIYADDKGELISFQNGILDSLSDDGVRSVIGHELGHHGYRHTVLPEVFGLCSQYYACCEADELPAGKRSAAQRKLLTYWSSDTAERIFQGADLLSQLEEFNADRAGLLACPNLRENINAAMILVGGRQDRFGTYDPITFLVQGRELLRSKDAFDDEPPSTHPNGKIRAIAIEYFWRSDVFRDLTGCGSADVKLKDFDKLLGRLLPLRLLPFALSSVPTSNRLPAFLLSPPRLDGPVAATGIAPALAAPPRVPELSISEALAQAEWVEAELIEEPADSAGLTPLEVGKLRHLLALSAVSSDGKLTAGETRFLTNLIRPGRLAHEVHDYWESLTQEAWDSESAALYERARGASSRMKGSLVRSMVHAVKADRTVTNDEIMSVLQLSELIGAETVAQRELRNAFGSRLDDALSAL
jgi:Zn-dependent protease with chaperone function